ncbi:MAG: alanine--tRNA ligase [Gemmatimonadetes bacterium]|nr:alanine--tRNA ligase [Gemmatimonadota bacterium]
MHSSDIRKSFIDYFLSRGHTEVPSSPLVPADDPTLLFTNAGMVQFKRVFQGLENRAYKRAVTSQKCVRAGGKHNDLEQVGHTALHHTFFEMLGNFSFGDYFKKEAIEYAWEWVTSNEYLGIHPDRLYMSVHRSDDEARKLWREVTGVSDERIYGMGDKDNFWQMGDTGPCGPCSEVFIDLREGNRERGSGKRTSRSPLPAPSSSEFEALAESGDFVEIWNLVFMQFDQAADGSRSPLPAPSVDTGAGLERIAAVMQGVESNFDTDLFKPIIERAVELIGRPYDRGPEGAAYRVLADHARAIAFLLADGVYPSNDGRGYVLRRVLRRAVRHAYLMGRSKPTLVDLAEVVIGEMKEFYPELAAKADDIIAVTRGEEERFLETIEGGLARLEDLMSSGTGTLSGEQAFKLYDTYGFPIDLTEIIAREKGWSVDVPIFEKYLAEQQERSRSAIGNRSGAATASVIGKRKGKFQRVKPRVRQKFVGYQTTDAETDILAFRQSSDRLDLVLHENPFYLESGGQVSDTGQIEGQGWELEVTEVAAHGGKTFVSGSYEGPFEPTPVRARVAEQRRRDIERNHTATHLVHAALRSVLGKHVRQAGSVVDPNRLRFDFSHQGPLSDEELRNVEQIVNEGVWRNAEVDTHELPYRDAIERGAMALFGEKYSDVVRVVDIPELSLELCGGTHVRSTGQIGLFSFVGESGVAAGVRRIEAITGRGAYVGMRNVQEHVQRASEILHTSPEHVAKKVDTLLNEKRKLEKQVRELVKSGGGSLAEAGEKHELGDTTLTVASTTVSDRRQIGVMIDSFRDKSAKAILVVFAAGDRPGIHVGVTDDLIANGVKAGVIVDRIASLAGGRGGGRPHFASAGVSDPSKVPYARSRTPGIVAEALGLRMDV